MTDSNSNSTVNNHHLIGNQTALPLDNKFTSGELNSAFSSISMSLPHNDDPHYMQSLSILFANDFNNLNTNDVSDKKVTTNNSISDVTDSKVKENTTNPVNQDPNNHLDSKSLFTTKSTFNEKELALKFLDLFIKFCQMHGNYHMYNLCLMNQSLNTNSLKKNTIYLQKKNHKQLEYTVINPDGKKVNGIININISGNLTDDVLSDKKAYILDRLAEKGDINYQEFRIFKVEGIENKEQEYFNVTDMPEIILGIIKCEIDYEDTHVIPKGKLWPNKTIMAYITYPIGIKLIAYRDLLRKYFNGPKLLTNMQLNLAIIFLDFLNTLVIKSSIGMPLSTIFNGFKPADLIDLLKIINGSQFKQILLLPIPESYTDSLGVTATASDIENINTSIQKINVQLHTKSGILSFSMKANWIKNSQERTIPSNILLKPKK